MAGALALVGLGAGLGVALSGSSSSGSDALYTYYQQMMSGYGGGSMMGGSGYSWIMGPSGYGWMIGGSSSVPGWMNGGSLPGFMMGNNADPGQVMGRLFANAPGPRVSTSEATKLGNAVPPGATVNRFANQITFSGQNIAFTVLASPPGDPDETFRVGGLVNPTVTVQAGAQVSIQFINADPDTAHGLVVTSRGSSDSWMPMMTASQAFPGAAVWFLGDPTSAGLHAASMSFAATTPGTYHYLCPVPGHAQKGMVATFVVRG